jgi:hypothetical protein
MKKGDLSACLARFLAAPMGVLSGAMHGAEEVREEIDADIVDRDSAFWANTWRGSSWFFLLAIGGLLSILLAIISTRIDWIPIKYLADIFGYIGFFSLMPVLTHGYRAGVAWYLLPRDRKPDVRRLRWASPKLRDGYAGMALGLFFVAFAFFGGFGLVLHA